MLKHKQLSDSLINKKNRKELENIQEDILKHVMVVDQEWLPRLFDYYEKRFTSDNDKIWTIGTIFAPISISAFPFYFTLDKSNFFFIFLLGFASCLLSSIWLVFAENHRAFQNTSFIWMQAILKRIGFNSDPVPAKLGDDWLNKKISATKAVKYSIRFFCFSVVLAWICIFISHLKLPNFSGLWFELYNYIKSL